MVGCLSIVVLLALCISLPVLTIYNLRLKKRKRALIYLGLFMILFLGIVVPNFRHARHCGQYTACRSNLFNIGTAMEMYRSDNEGCYPPSLSCITPKYLRTIPTCPSAGMQTYMYISRSVPDLYTVWCSGAYHRFYIKNHHANHKPGFPQYNSEKGLIDDH